MRRPALDRIDSAVTGIWPIGAIETPRPSVPIAVQYHVTLEGGAHHAETASLQTARRYAAEARASRPGTRPAIDCQFYNPETGDDYPADEAYRLLGLTP